MMEELILEPNLVDLIDEYFSKTGNYDLLLKEYFDLVTSEKPFRLKFSKELNKHLRNEKKELKRILLNTNNPKNLDVVPQIVSASFKYIKFRNRYARRLTSGYVKWVLNRDKKITREEMIACHFLGEVIERGEKDYVGKIMPLIYNLTRLETGITIPHQLREGFKKMVIKNYFFWKKSIILSDNVKEDIGKFVDELFKSILE